MLIASSSTTKRLCRNVIIHGFCKFQDKGCEFNHETVINNNYQKVLCLIVVYFEGQAFITTTATIIGKVIL